MTPTGLTMLVAGLLAIATALQGDSTLPQYRPADVRIVGDTAWFVPDLTPVRAGPVPVIGFARATGTWVTGLRRRSALRENDREVPTSGTHWMLEQLAAPVELPWGYAIVDTTPQPDPRFPATADQEAVTTVRRALARGSRRIDELRIRVTGDERRRLYLAAGGTLDAGEVPPPFTTVLSRWASGEGVLAFGFDAPAPPELDDGSMAFVDPADLEYPRYLTGLLLYDTTANRVRPALHPAILEKQFIGLEIAAGAVWAAPVEPDPERASGDTIRLVRFDVAARTWRLYTDRDMPVERAALRRGDGEHLYFIGGDGVAVLDARTGTWSARWLRDSVVVLADGAEMTVTRSYARRPPMRRDTIPTPGVLEMYPEVDTAVVASFLARELGVRRREPFVRALRSRVSIDSLQSLAIAIESGRMSRYYEGEILPGPHVWEQVVSVLRAPEFEPFVAEMMLEPHTWYLAIDVLAARGGGALREGYRAALHGGTIDAAIAAADSLLALGDTTALPWLRARLHDPHWIEIGEFVPGWAYSQTPLQRVITTLAKLGDTSFVTRALELLDEPAVRYPVLHQSIALIALLEHRDPRVRARVIARLERTPSLWPLLFHARTDSLPDSATLVRDALRRIALRLASSSVAFTDSIAAAWPRAHRRNVDRRLLLGVAVNILTGMDPIVAVPVLIETFDRDPFWAYQKHYALIRMTGNDAAPKDPDYMDPATAAPVAAYWRAWWTTRRADFRPATPAEGEAAYTRWARRHYPR